MQLPVFLKTTTVVMTALERKQRGNFPSSGAAPSNSSNFLEDYLQKELPADFIQRTNTDNLVQNALAALLQSRPKDPISWLADYFGAFIEPKNKLLEAHEKIMMNHYSSSIFENNLIDAYQAFNETGKTKNAIMRKSLQGDDHNELLMILTKDMPIKYAEPLLKKLIKPERQSITLSVFRSDVTTVLLFQDFVKTTLSIYEDIDFNGKGNAHKELCKLFLSELKSILENGTFCGKVSNNLNISMTRYLSQPLDGQEGNVMKLDEFVQSALEIFLRYSQY